MNSIISPRELVDHSMSRALHKRVMAEIEVTGAGNPAIFKVEPPQRNA